MPEPAIDWQPAVEPFGVFSFVPGDPDEPVPCVDGRTVRYGLLDGEGRPVWEDESGELWAGPWPAEASVREPEEEQ